MAETKFALILFNLLGIPVYILGFFANLDNIKSAILFLLGLIYMMIQIYFNVIWAKQKTRMRELDIQQKEKDLKDD